MSGRRATTRIGTGHGSGLWPVLIALLIVLAPTACVLWFLNEAVRNERLAGKQRLVEAYRGYLPMLRERLDVYWQQQSEALDAATADQPWPTAFAACVRDGLADSVVRLSPLPQAGEGTVAISPLPQAAGTTEWSGPGVRAAANSVAGSATAVPANLPADRPHPNPLPQAGEGIGAIEQDDPARAANAYAEAAANGSDDQRAAEALQAQARCLARIGRTQEAIAILADELGKDRFARCQDSAGRLIGADAQLRALELIDDRTDSRFSEVADRLTARLNDYRDADLPSTQRRFLMKELYQLTQGWADLPTLIAECLAAEYLELPPRVADGFLRPSGVPDVWQLASPSGRVVGLLTSDTVRARIARVGAEIALPDAVRLTPLPPGVESVEDAIPTVPAGARMPGWRLSLAMVNAEASDAVDRRVAAYVWIAVLLIAAMSILAVFVGGVLRRQMRVARLKNDLLATVSHELKTPLSSIRLLVDTLLDADALDSPTTREYLELVARENARLSHLIDNFLSFSRMERGKRTFEFVECAPSEIVRRAVEAAGERFQSPTCRLRVETAAGLPPVMADADALVTALLNLLDNAYKYSGEQKEIMLRTDAVDGGVRFSVSDRGIGMTPRALKKVFRPFFQVDQQLSRQVGGCGLGLSIVRFIVTAHGGAVSVDSRLGQGSTFMVWLPRGFEISSEERSMP